MEHNAVAGCTHYGYWYRLVPIIDELSNSTIKEYYPYKQPFGGFHNNSVHSTGLYGVWIYPEYAPTISGNSSDNSSSKATFEGVVSWKNRKGIEYYKSKPIQIADSLFFDNTDASVSCIYVFSQENTFYSQNLIRSYDTENSSSVINSIIIAYSNISNEAIAESTIGLISKSSFYVLIDLFLNDL